MESHNYARIFNRFKKKKNSYNIIKKNKGFERV